MSDASALQLQARATISEQLLRQALRHAVSNATFGIQGDNRLRHLSASALAFEPGCRTRDDGLLGSKTATAQFNLEPPANDTVLWSLQDSAGRKIASVTRATGAPVTINASSGGHYVLTAQRASDQQTIGAAQLSVPAFIRIRAQLDHNVPSLSALRVPASLQPAVWAAFIDAARPVAQHILRPINVRLVWDDDRQPAPFLPTPPPAEHEQPLSALAPVNLGREFNDQQVHRYPGTVMLVSPDTVLQGSPAALESLLQSLPNEVAASLLRQKISQFLQLDTTDSRFPRTFPDEPGWSLDAALSIGGYAVLRCGLGAVDFNGMPVSASQGDDADRALNALAAAVDWDAPTAAPYLRCVEFIGRHLGVCIAHAVLRLLGVQAPRDGGHLRDASQATLVAASITASHPNDAACDLLGLQRPDITPLRTFDELSADLDHQATRAANATRPEAGRWVDVAALESASWRTGTLKEPMRAMPGATSKYDVLAGLVDDAALHQLEGMLGMLPPPYGDVTFAPGDRDVLPDAPQQSRYGGEPCERSDMIELMQRDLAAVGIGVGLQDRGEYAYRRFSGGADHYDGWPANQTVPNGDSALKDSLMDGNTGWAVREFQLACRYPNRVHERLSGGSHYAEQLHVVQTQPSPLNGNGPVLAEPDPAVDGELDIIAAHQLRQWRFTRRRYPIVIVTGTSAGPHHQPTHNNKPLPTVENLHRTNGIRSDRYRVFTFDRSGYFGAPQEALTLGDWGKIGGWSGPHASTTHAQSVVTPDNVLGVPQAQWDPAQAGDDAIERQRRERFLDVYRPIAAVAQAESRGRFDSLNAYDDAVFSYPLFHHTLGLSVGRPGQMAAFVRWLQAPPDELLASVFPDPGAKDSHWVADTAATAQRHRAELSQVMQRVYAQCFGHFGIGASQMGGNAQQDGFMTVAGLETALTAAGVEVDLQRDWNRQSSADRSRQQALYQSYQNWFRIWHWCYRFIAALRHHQPLRTLLFAYEAHWIDRFMSSHFDAFRTQPGQTLAVRIQIRGQRLFNLSAARQAVEGQTDEARAILDAILTARDLHDSGSPDYKSLNNLHNSSSMAANFNQANLRPWQRGQQSKDIYWQVRNDVLRSMVGE